MAKLSGVKDRGNGFSPDAAVLVPPMSQNDIERQNLSADERNRVQQIQNQVTEAINDAIKQNRIDSAPNFYIKVIDHISGKERQTCYIIEGIPAQIESLVVTAVSQTGNCLYMEYADHKGDVRVRSAGIAFRFLGGTYSRGESINR